MYRGSGLAFAGPSRFNEFGPSHHQGNMTPSGPPYHESAKLDARRRQTLISLLDALHELGQDDVLSRDMNEYPCFEDDSDAPNADEHLQIAGAESFNKFHKRINNLDKELRNFANAARQLGSSVGILSSAFRLREGLAQILFLFRENAAHLFPRKVTRQPRESLVNPNIMNRRRKFSRRKKAPQRVGKPLIDDTLDSELFPEQLESFATDVMTFLTCLNEFPEFTDEAVNVSMESFEGDLKYWASCLQAYRGQLKYPAVQRYIHDLTMEMGEHIDNITRTLSMFIEIGVPTIRYAQKHGATNLLNLSTVAIFFSAVTATTLQFSFHQTGNVLSDAVNAFWFSSLVFSIAAAVNSLLGLTWTQAMYRSPGHRVPWWVLIWIKRSPLVFLVISVACFSAGLVLFTYSSGQGRVTSTITTVFTAFTSFGLAAVSAWFASEKWTFVHHRGQKWLSDVLADSLAGFTSLRVVVLLTSIFTWGTERLRAARLPFNGTTEDVHESVDVTVKTILPMSHMQEPQSPSRLTMRDAGSFMPEIVSRPGSPASQTSDHMSTSTPTPRVRLTNAIRSVMMLQSISAPSSLLSPIIRRPTVSSSFTGKASETRSWTSLEPLNTMRTPRVGDLVPKLRSLVATQDLAAHTALVRHLQFSPNGKFLATSSWDRTSVIFRVGEPCVPHRTLAHSQGFVGQVAWSPTGRLLLTKLNRGIKVWTEDGECKRTIFRHQTVQCLKWLPRGEAFMSVEGSEVVKLDLHGKVLDTYEFQRTIIHDITVTPDGQRLLGVGRLLSSPSGLQPSKSRVEKQLLVYNIDTKQIENQTPVLNDVRDITLARNDLVALVSYENKAPPQLWKLEIVKGRDGIPTTSRLTLRHTYMPKMRVDFAGPSYFGGTDDQLVLCAGKAGDIHIWDRESAILLHHVRGQALGGDLTSIAWNHAADSPFMFATGSHDGAVTIWTSLMRDHQWEDGPSSITPLCEQRTPYGHDILRTESPTPQGEYMSQPLSMSPTEENGFVFRQQGHRSVTFAPPQHAETV